MKTLLAGISGVSFQTTANGVVIDGLTGSETATDTSLASGHALGGGSVAVTIVRTVVV